MISSGFQKSVECRQTIQKDSTTAIGVSFGAARMGDDLQYFVFEYNLGACLYSVELAWCIFHTFHDNDMQESDQT